MKIKKKMAGNGLFKKTHLLYIQLDALDLTCKIVSLPISVTFAM